MFQAIISSTLGVQEVVFCVVRRQENWHKPQEPGKHVTRVLEPREKPLPTHLTAWVEMLLSPSESPPRHVKSFYVVCARQSMIASLSQTPLVASRIIPGAPSTSIIPTLGPQSINRTHLGLFGATGYVLSHGATCHCMPIKHCFHTKRRKHNSSLPELGNPSPSDLAEDHGKSHQFSCANPMN